MFTRSPLLPLVSSCAPDSKQLVGPQPLQPLDPGLSSLTPCAPLLNPFSSLSPIVGPATSSAPAPRPSCSLSGLCGLFSTQLLEVSLYN